MTAARSGWPLRALAVWVVIAGVEFIHGALRSIFLVPVTGELRSRQIGVFTGALLILIVAWLFIRWVGVAGRGALLRVGLLWLVLMVSFELALGRLLGRPWDLLFSDYDVTRGGFLAFGMVVLTLSPLIATRLRRRGEQAG